MIVHQLMPKVSLIALFVAVTLVNVNEGYVTWPRPDKPAYKPGQVPSSRSPANWRTSFQQLWRLRGAGGMTDYYGLPNMYQYQKKRISSLHPVVFLCPSSRLPCQHGGVGPKRTWSPARSTWICVCLCQKGYRGPLCNVAY